MAHFAIWNNHVHNHRLRKAVPVVEVEVPGRLCRRGRRLPIGTSRVGHSDSVDAGQWGVSEHLGLRWPCFRDPLVYVLPKVSV
jgi:hypothetical protein